MTDFAELAASRRAWLDDILRPWCQQAERKDLRLAELEWIDLAGKVDAQKTLWSWAWSRFPALVHEELGIDESVTVIVTLNDGQQFTGHPDARESQQGMLVLVGKSAAGRIVNWGPFSLDDIASVERREQNQTVISPNSSP